MEHGDCLERMAALPEGYATSVVTDPPYGLSFMGREWDHGIPGVPFWSEALRVSKPGAYLLAFGGTRTFHRLACAIEDAGWEIRDCLSWMYGQGWPKAKNALKPAWEPILLARKPFKGTVAANVLEHGTGALNIDGCRIEGGERPHIERRNDKALDGEVYGSGVNGSRRLGVFNTGRWPANVVLDEEAAKLLDAMAPKTGQSAALKATGRDRPGHGRLGRMGPPNGCEPKDSLAGASRFFYCAKASKKDRGPDNNHPTVKPIALMRWLVRLVTMPSGTLVLDPFMGSGTTGVACAEEGVGFHGIEMEAEHFATAKERIMSRLCELGG